MGAKRLGRGKILGQRDLPRAHMGVQHVEGRHDKEMGVSIEVNKLNAWYGSNHTLEDITLHIQANEATALIGPSGCGKSTFVRCLNRMHETQPDRPGDGRGEGGWSRHLRCEVGCGGTAADRNGLPAPESVSDDVDLRQCGVGPEAERISE